MRADPFGGIVGVVAQARADAGGGNDAAIAAVAGFHAKLFQYFSAKTRNAHAQAAQIFHRLDLPFEPAAHLPASAAERDRHQIAEFAALVIVDQAVDRLPKR